MQFNRNRILVSIDTDYSPPICCQGNYMRRKCCLTYQQATVVSGVLSMIFAAILMAHELIIEGGFSLRNYVIVAFCAVWWITASLLLVGVQKRAHFLLLPWLIFTCMLTPLFLVAVVAGFKILGSCDEKPKSLACIHEMHLFGDASTSGAALKLICLLSIFVTNTCSIFVVYKHFMLLTLKEDNATDDKLLFGDNLGSLRYDDYNDEANYELQQPLCENMETEIT